MLDKDFDFLAVRENIENAYALRDFLSDFEVELRRRFSNALKTNMQKNYDVLRRQWVLSFDNEGMKEVFLASFKPRKGSGIIDDAWVRVGFNIDDNTFVEPFWGVCAKYKNKKARTISKRRIVDAVVGVMTVYNDDDDDEDEDLVYEMVDEFCDAPYIDNVVRIVEGCDHFAKMIADKAVVLAQTLKSVSTK